MVSEVVKIIYFALDTVVLSLKMSERDVISLTSVVKGHHVYDYEYQIPERFKCCVEDNNLFSRHAIVVKSKKEGEEIIGHVPDSLANILRPLMSAGIVICINGRIIARHIRAPEGTWTQGGGIQIQCKYKIYCKRQHRQYVRNKLKK